MLTHHLKKIITVYVCEVCKVMSKEKRAKTHHEYPKCANENERPENEPPEEIIIDRKMTYSLRNGKSSRELSQNSYFSNKHLPTKRVCCRHVVTMWIDCILPSGSTNKHISCRSSMFNRHYLLAKTNGQMIIRCNIFCTIISHKLMRIIRIILDFEQLVDIHSARKTTIKIKLCFAW